MNKQEFKITDLDSGFSTYFFQHNLQSAAHHVEQYIKRNSGKFPMSVYQVNTSPCGPRWILIRTQL